MSEISVISKYCKMLIFVYPIPSSTLCLINTRCLYTKVEFIFSHLSSRIKPHFADEKIPVDKVSFLFYYTMIRPDKGW